MLVGSVVTVTFVFGCAIGGISSAYRDFVVVAMVVVHVVHVSIMKIVFVTFMLYGLVSTAFAVFVIVIFMLTVAAHHLLLQILTKKFVW